MDRKVSPLKAEGGLSLVAGESPQGPGHPVTYTAFYFLIFLSYYIVALLRAETRTYFSFDPQVLTRVTFGGSQ